MNLKRLFSMLRPARLAYFVICVIFVPLEVMGACQPYIPNPDFLKEIQTDDGMKRVFPRQSPEQKETVMALVRTPSRSPEQIAALAQVELFWRAVPGRMDGVALRVSSPYEYRLKDADYYIRNATKAEFDPYGDGKFERIQDGKRSYSFEAPGEYQPTLRIFDANGLAYAQTMTLKVLSPGDFDAHIQAIWNDMKDALRRSDITAAIECIYSGSRPRYYKGFQSTTELARKVDELFGSIKWVKNELSGAAAYSHTLKGVEQPTETRFVTDVDGVWRLR